MSTSENPGPVRRRTLLRRLFPMRGVATAAAILLVIGTAGFLSVEYLKRSARIMVQDSLEGLRDASLADASVVETYNKTLLFVMAGSDAERARYRSDFETYNLQVVSAVNAYAASIFAADDRTNFNIMLQRRDAYIAARNQLVAMVEAGKYDDARAAFKTSLTPAYSQCKSAVDTLVKYNLEKSHARGQVILDVCIVTQFCIAGSGIGLFVLGFILGFFK